MNKYQITYYYPYETEINEESFIPTRIEYDIFWITAALFIILLITSYLC